MRILIDGRFIGVGESISRYTLEILRGILELDRENKYTLLMRPQGEKIAKQFFSLENGVGSAEKDTPRPTPNLQLKIFDIPHYSLAEQTKLLKYLNQERFDLVHFTQFNHPVRYRGKFVITIHDLTLLGHLHRMNFLKRFAFRIVMKSAVKNSEEIITVSDTTKKDLVETLGVKPEKISVTHLGVDCAYNAQISHLSSRISHFKEKYHIAGDYILYTGMWKRHKNLLRMLQAFEQYKKQETRNPSTALGASKKQIDSKSQTQKDCHSELVSESPGVQLVLVGKIDKEEPEVINLIDKINHRIKNNELRIKSKRTDTHNSSFVLHNSIIATGFIDEEELPIAYAGATVYIIPSLSEGFGLPPLEAMACGTPVLSSNISAMPEILGKAPFYFDPYNVEDMSMAIKTVVEDKDLQAELSKKGLEQAKRYDWKLTAKRTLNVYRSVLK